MACPCYKFDNALLGMGPREKSAHLPVFHLRNTNLLGPAESCETEHNKEDLSANMTKNVCRETTFIKKHMIALLSCKAFRLTLFYTSKARFFDAMLDAVHSAPMSAFAGLTAPRRPLVAELSYDEKALVWALFIESGHIPLRTIFGNSCRDLYRPLRLRSLAWAQQVVFQDLHHVWALLTGEWKSRCRGDVHDRAPVYQVF